MQTPEDMRLSVLTDGRSSVPSDFGIFCPQWSYNTPSRARTIEDDVTGNNTISADAKPSLPRGVRLVHNEAQGGWVLLAPKRVFRADPIAHQILKRCTGEASVQVIVDDLAKAFNAPRERIHDDVVKLLASLADKKLLEL
jgi:pyrroloquinoline quinone biosynthesis protein D